MHRLLGCDHCGTSVTLETRTDPEGMRLLTHLLSSHGELITFEELPGWEELLGHFHLVLQRYPSTARVAEG